MSNNDIALSRELREYENEKKMDERVLNAERQKIAMMLKGEMGQDIKNVLSGKTKIALTRKEKMHYRMRNFSQKIIRIINKIFTIL